MGAEVSVPEAPAVPTADSASNGSGNAEPRALVICGPSGVGKGTLIQKLMASGASDKERFGFSVSHTTRAPREGEQNGTHYHFTTRETFVSEVAEGKFLEHAEVHGNMYGTSVAAVQAVLSTGRVCILDIDVQGARQVRKSALKAIFVFIAPPSLYDLEQRLRGRGTETEEQVQRRLANATKEIESLKEDGLFDYLLVNDSLEECFTRLAGIANRALAGLDAEPGQVPATISLEAALRAAAPQPSSLASAAAPATAAVAGIAPSKANGVSVAPGMGLERWKGKVALVTGASSGIGWAACEALAKAGLRVVAVARRREKLEKLQTHMTGLGVTPESFLPVVCDVTKDAEVQALPKIVGRRWEGAGVDVLVNNAGLSRNDASLFDGNTAAWVEMISTNLLGTCMCAREVVRSMKARGQWGHIINMVGLSGHRIPDGPQGGGFYCATKFAVRCITEGLRQEARGQGVPLRVSGISPGVVETEFFSVRSYGDETAARSVTSQFPCLQPQDIAQAMLWCLSAPDHMEVNDVVVRPTQQLI